MELPNHSLNSLFDQLGLPSKDKQIEDFVAGHQLGKGCLLRDAAFWTDAQRQFLVEEHAEDADWTPWIDELDVMLHQDVM